MWLLIHPIAVDTSVDCAESRSTRKAVSARSSVKAHLFGDQLHSCERASAASKQQPFADVVPIIDHSCLHLQRMKFRIMDAPIVSQRLSQNRLPFNADGVIDPMATP